MKAFREAVEARDIEAVIALVSPEIVFHSPALHRPFAGIDAVRAVLTAALATFEDFRYTDSLEGDGCSILVFEARTGDKLLQGIDLLRLDDDGKIADFTVMIRPLTGLQAFAAAMAAHPLLSAAVANR